MDTQTDDTAGGRLDNRQYREGSVKVQHATSNESGKGQSVRQSLLDLPVLFQMTPGDHYAEVLSHTHTHCHLIHLLERRIFCLWKDRQISTILSILSPQKAIYTGINKTVSDTTTKHLQFTRQLLLNIKIVCSS